jgi:hypothetical protein
MRYRLCLIILSGLLGALVPAGVAHAEPASENTFTFNVVCDGQPLTFTVVIAAHPPSSNGAAGHVVGSSGVGVLMGLSVLDLTTGESTEIFGRPLAERQELATCTYTFEPLLPAFLVFTAEVLLTPRN